MAKGEGSGWHREPGRHRQAALGIPTVKPGVKPVKRKRLAVTSELTFPGSLLDGKDGMAERAFRHVLKAIFGKNAPTGKHWEITKDGIDIELVDRSSTYSRHAMFGGIKMSFIDDTANYRKVWRKVTVKKGTFDTGAALEKFQELRELKRQSEEASKRKVKRRQSREARLKQLKKQAGITEKDFWQNRLAYDSEWDEKKFKLTLSDLSPAEVKRIMKARKGG